MIWHAVPVSDVERQLGTNVRAGLSGDEVKKRFAERGPNELPAGKPETFFGRFVRQFKSPLIYILAAAAAVVFAQGHGTDGLLIVGVLVMNAVIGAAQEGRAEQTLIALRDMAKTNSTVLRDGKENIVPDRELVPGDVVLLEEGEKVPADIRIVESRTLRADQAALTGESVPVRKSEADIADEKTLLAERANMLYKGTTIASGAGKGIVIATGSDTEIGAISKAVASIDTEIPLTKNIAFLSRVIVVVVIGVSAALFLVGIAAGKSSAEMFTTVVALTVSLVPEGLPLVLTLVLASGVWRMAKRNALVKKLHAVEALGQAKIIAVDKTGTLTRNEMVVRRVYAGGRMFEVGGVGYEPTGEVREGDHAVDPPNHPELLLAGKIGTNCGRAHLVYDEKSKTWKMSGDPTEAALEVFGKKLNFHKEELEQESPLIEELPFDYQKKYHVAAHRENGKQFVSMAGSPESVLALSSRIRIGAEEKPLHKDGREETEKALHAMLKDGYRVVGFVYGEADLGDAQALHDPKEMVFGGFYGIEDSLRPEAPEAVRRAQEAGIRVVMITGDHKLTAAAIAREAGILSENGRIMTMDEMEALSEQELAAILPDIQVFARITPEYKMRIIGAYRRAGNIVAMTGDGVNDAPSLVAADLGVAMGKIGTEVAKEAADIILLDDNFGSIVSAVEEGRHMYKTIQKVLLYLFSTNLGELFVVAGAIFAGLPLPVLPAQILWLNFVTDPFTGIALAFEPRRGHALGEFKKPNKYLLSQNMLMRIALMAAVMMVGTLAVFALYARGDLVKAYTMSVTTLAIFQWFNAWNCRSESQSIFSVGVFSNRPLVLATLLVALLQIAIVYIPALQNIFTTTALTLAEWGIATAIAATILVAEEMRKILHRMLQKTPSTAAPNPEP